MQAAIFEGKIIKATPKAKGFCRLCGSEVIAKCGTKKIWHWAHKDISDCDEWKSEESDWHRSWKGKFPLEWQEHPVVDESSGKRHRADVKTDEDWVIEFQNSSISLDDRKARNNFYKKLLWVVNGFSLKSYLKQFNKMAANSLLFLSLQIQQASNIDNCSLIKDWENSNVPVFFDFNGPQLALLLPKGTAKKSYISTLSREMFIKMLTHKEFDAFYEGVIKSRVENLHILEQQQEFYLNKYKDPQLANNILNQQIAQNLKKS